MNFEHYKNFLTIVDVGTISAASRLLLIAQPALSNQLKALEDEYGTQLVIRTPRKIELTDAGRILYDKLKAICYLEDSAKKEISACATGNRGTLWLGTSPANPDPLFYDTVMEFHEKYPDVTFEIFERNSNYIVQELQSGMLEVGLIRRQISLLPPDIRPVLAIDEHYMACFHRDHELLSPSMEQIPLRYLKDLPISISHGLRNTFTAACEREGFSPRYLYVSASRSTSQYWASDKHTVSIIVNPIPYDEGEFCYREIGASELTTQRIYAVNRNRRLSAVAENFLQFCRSASVMDRWTKRTGSEISANF